MTEVQDQVVRFLTALAKAVSSLTLYERAHPAAERAVWNAFEGITALQKLEPRPVLTFLGDEVVFRERPIKSLRSWEWGMKLADVGIQRLECHGPVTLSDFDKFVDALFRRLSDPDTDPTPGDESSSIRFGMVGLKDMEASLSELGGDLVGFTLAEEVAAMTWLDEECRIGGKLHLLEADTIVRSLAVAMHADVELMIPLVDLKGYDQYTTTHSLNISVLSMALGEFLGLDSKYVRRLGVAGLLHDIGKTKVPRELLNKSGKLDAEERAAIELHPVEGARILIQREANMDLAATVAYEHHIRFDGGGYPVRRFRRPCHPASNLVHLCDVYDALRTHRPYRKAWGQERVLDYIEESMGSEFDPTLGKAFLEMMHRWGSRLYRVTSTEDAVGLGESDEPDKPAEAPAEAVPTAVESAEAEAPTPATTPAESAKPAKSAMEPAEAKAMMAAVQAAEVVGATEVAEAAKALEVGEAEVAADQVAADQIAADPVAAAQVGAAADRAPSGGSKAEVEAEPATESGPEEAEVEAHTESEAETQTEPEAVEPEQVEPEPVEPEEAASNVEAPPAAAMAEMDESDPEVPEPEAVEPEVEESSTADIEIDAWADHIEPPTQPIEAIERSEEEQSLEDPDDDPVPDAEETWELSDAPHSNEPAKVTPSANWSDPDWEGGGTPELTFDADGEPMDGSVLAKLPEAGLTGLHDPVTDEAEVLHIAEGWWAEDEMDEGDSPRIVADDGELAAEEEREQNSDPALNEVVREADALEVEDQKADDPEESIPTWAIPADESIEGPVGTGDPAESEELPEAAIAQGDEPISAETESRAVAAEQSPAALVAAAPMKLLAATTSAADALAEPASTLLAEENDEPHEQDEPESAGDIEAEDTTGEPPDRVPAERPAEEEEEDAESLDEEVLVGASTEPGDASADDGSRRRRRRRLLR